MPILHKEAERKGWDRGRWRGKKKKNAGKKKRGCCEVVGPGRRHICRGKKFITERRRQDGRWKKKEKRK